ncbi:hypothetical protein [Actinoplanes sp. NPDC049802]|uniref:hypothetical protein n=1 Tax=Actinoplanes sp. NPDC049802 TaxID=3154742 RepID=UPI0033F61CCB
MLDDLEAAVRGYDDARKRVSNAALQLAEARAAVPPARMALGEAIVAAAVAGARQVDIMQVTGYSREQVRRILRAAGVEADTTSD